MEEHDLVKRISWNESLVLAEESEDYEAIKICKKMLAQYRQAGPQSSAASTSQDNDSPSPNAEIVPVQSYAMDADDYRDAWHNWHDLQETAMSQDLTAGAPAPLSPSASDSEDSSSEDAPLTNDVNEAEFKWLNLVDNLTEHKLTWDKSLTVQSVWDEAYRERYALKEVGWVIQLWRKDAIRRWSPC